MCDGAKDSPTAGEGGREQEVKAIKVEEREGVRAEVMP